MFIIDTQGFGKTKNENPPTQEIEVTSKSAGRSAHGWQIGRHWLAGNSHFPCGMIFIFCFSEPLGINIGILMGLLLW